MLFRGVYLAARKRRIGFVRAGCFALGSLSPCECLSGSTRPLTFRVVRRGSPSCRSCYRSVIRLIPLLGYSGERPRLRRACNHPRNSAELLQQHSIVRKQCSSFRAVRILSSSLEALCSLCLMQLREHIGAPRKRHAERIERIINAFVPRKAFCSSALMQTFEQVSGRSPRRFFGVKQKGLSPVSPHAGFRACTRLSAG